MVTANVTQKHSLHVIHCNAHMEQKETNVQIESGWLTRYGQFMPNHWLGVSPASIILQLHVRTAERQNTKTFVLHIQVLHHQCCIGVKCAVVIDVTRNCITTLPMYESSGSNMPSAIAMSIFDIHTCNISDPSLLYHSWLLVAGCSPNGISLRTR